MDFQLIPLDRNRLDFLYPIRTLHSIRMGSDHKHLTVDYSQFLDRLNIHLDIYKLVDGLQLRTMPKIHTGKVNHIDH